MPTIEMVFDRDRRIAELETLTDMVRVAVAAYDREEVPIGTVMITIRHMINPPVVTAADVDDATAEIEAIMSKMDAQT